MAKTATEIGMILPMVKQLLGATLGASGACVIRGSFKTSSSQLLFKYNLGSLPNLNAILA